MPSLKQYIREIAKAVPSPQGGTVYDEWKKARTAEKERVTRASIEWRGSREPAAS